MKTKNAYGPALRFIAPYIRRYRKYFLPPLCASFVLTAINLLNTQITARLIDSSMSGVLRDIVISVLAFLLLTAVQVAVAYFSRLSSEKLSAHITRDIKNEVGERITVCDDRSLLSQKTGDLLMIANEDTVTTHSFVSSELMGLFSQFVLALGSFIYLFFCNGLLALVTFAYTPIGMFFTTTLNKKLGKLYAINADRKSDALSLVEQMLSQIPVIKSFVMEKKMKQRVKAQYQNVVQSEMRMNKLHALMETACSTTAQVPKMLFMVFAGYWVVQGTMTMGAYVSLFLMLMNIIAPTVLFPFLLNDFNRSVASLNRLRRIFELPKAAPSARHPADVPEIRIDNIDFSYDGSKNVIQNLSFHHTGSGVIAIRGESGSGKSTLLDVLSGRYPPTKGSVRVLGSMAVLTQEPYIFQASVLENVRLFKTHIPLERVAHACEMAGVADFVSALPQGYDTLLGEGNLELSGGQKQRISLARVFLEDAQVMLMDEPTSALDARTEEVIRETLQRLASTKLIVIVAHRQSLIDMADRVIDFGGNHESH